MSLLLFAGRLDTDNTGSGALPMDIRFIDTMLAGAQASLEFSDTFSVNGRIGWNDVEHLMDNFGLRLAPVAMAQRENFTTGSGVEFTLGGELGLSSSIISGSFPVFPTPRMRHCPTCRR